MTAGPHEARGWASEMSGGFFDGAIDEIRIYKSAVLPADLQMICQSTQ